MLSFRPRGGQHEWAADEPFDRGYGRVETLKRLLFAERRTTGQTLGLLAFLCIPLTLGVWIRFIVTNFYAASRKCWMANPQHLRRSMTPLPICVSAWAPYAPNCSPGLSRKQPRKRRSLRRTCKDRPNRNTRCLPLLLQPLWRNLPSPAGAGVCVGVAFWASPYWVGCWGLVMPPLNRSIIARLLPCRCFLPNVAAR